MKIERLYKSGYTSSAQVKVTPEEGETLDGVIDHYTNNPYIVAYLMDMPLLW